MQKSEHTRRLASQFQPAYLSDPTRFVSLCLKTSLVSHVPSVNCPRTPLLTVGVSICNGQGQKNATIPLSLCMRTTPEGEIGFLNTGAMFASYVKAPCRDCKQIKKPDTRQWPTHGKVAAGWGALLSTGVYLCLEWRSTYSISSALVIRAMPRDGLSEMLFQNKSSIFTEKLLHRKGKCGGGKYS